MKSPLTKLLSNLLPRLVLFSAASLAACGKPSTGGNSASDIYLFNGKPISEETHPHVYSIGGCTATFLSDNTLITAAHCVRNGGTVRIARRLNATSLKVVHHPSYGGRLGINDVAIAIFPKGTSQHTAPLFNGSIRTGDDVFAVGYGCTNGGGSGGTKREGSAKIASLRNGVIGLVRQTNSPGAGSDVTLCPGDSGGPLFKNGAVVGIASYWDGGSGRSSGHADLTQESNRTFLRNMVAQGAVIPGLDGPVTPGTNPNGAPPGTTTNPSGIWVSLGAESTGSWELLTAAPATAADMVVCPGTVGNMCSPTISGAIRSSGRSAAGTQSIFKYAQNVNPALTPAISISILDAAGKVTSSRIVRFVPR